MPEIVIEPNSRSEMAYAMNGSILKPSSAVGDEKHAIRQMFGTNPAR
jgi:hypothetical protein